MGIEYKEVLLSYADLLGFRENLHSKTAEEIREGLYAFREGTTPEETFAGQYEVSYFNFSDLIVRTTHLNSDANRRHAIGLLFHELHDLAFGQAVMAGLGFLIRGAVTVGRVYTEPNMIFGEALVRAYELETKLAVYPRILVDPKVLRVFEGTDLLKKNTHDHETERPYIRELLSKGPDGIYFIDYLRVAVEDYGDQFYSFLNMHASLIRTMASQMNVLDAKSAKLSWLANYHNEVAREWGQAEELPMMFELPSSGGVA
jgi:hypothetical protein